MTESVGNSNFMELIRIISNEGGLILQNLTRMKKYEMVVLVDHPDKSTLKVLLWWCTSPFELVNDYIFTPYSLVLSCICSFEG